MSKKSRKKSSKSSSGSKPRAQSSAAAKTTLKKTRGEAAGKSSASASFGPSHKDASKPLKPAPAKKPAKTPARKAAAPSKPKVADSSAGRSSALTEGAKAPAFRLPRDGGSTVALSDFSGRKLVLFFYPRANTPGCTREAIDFTRLSGDFAKCGTAVLGISADPTKAQESFRDKHKLSVPLASDERHEMLATYGVWGEKSLYGRTFLGIIRTTVLLDADGRVARIWRNVRVDGHAETVLAAARGL